MSLQALAAQVAEHKRERLTVDVSEFCDPPQAPNTTVLVFEEPTIDEVYRAISGILDIRRNYPFWSEDRAMNVGLLAICHAEPKNEDPKLPNRVIYCDMSEKNGPMMAIVIRQFHEAYPWIARLFAEAQAKKNHLPSTPGSDSSASAADSSAAGIRSKSRSRRQPSKT